MEKICYVKKIFLYMWQEYYVYLEKIPQRFFHVHSNQAHMLIVHVVTTLQNNTFQCMHFRVTSTTKRKGG